MRWIIERTKRRVDWRIINGNQWRKKKKQIIWMKIIKKKKRNQREENKTTTKHTRGREKREMNTETFW